MHRNVSELAIRGAACGPHLLRFVHSKPLEDVTARHGASKLKCPADMEVLIDSLVVVGRGSWVLAIDQEIIVDPQMPKVVDGCADDEAEEVHLRNVHGKSLQAF